jgi:transposase
VAEKMDCHPGVFAVERHIHIRGKWVRKSRETIQQATMALRVIDEGLLKASLFAQVLVAGYYLDHLPLYRRETIFERAGHLIARTTLAQWVSECGVLLLADALHQSTRPQRQKIPGGSPPPGRSTTA